MKLFLDKEPILFKFTLPTGATSGNINSTYDSNLDNYIVPEDNMDDIDGLEQNPREVSSFKT